MNKHLRQIVKGKPDMSIESDIAEIGFKIEGIHRAVEALSILDYYKIFTPDQMKAIENQLNKISEELITEWDEKCGNADAIWAYIVGLEDKILKLEEKLSEIME